MPSFCQESLALFGKIVCFASPPFPCSLRPAPNVCPDSETRHVPRGRGFGGRVRRVDPADRRQPTSLFQRTTPEPSADDQPGPLITFSKQPFTSLCAIVYPPAQPVNTDIRPSPVVRGSPDPALVPTEGLPRFTWSPTQPECRAALVAANLIRGSARSFPSQMSNLQFPPLLSARHSEPWSPSASPRRINVRPDRHNISRRNPEARSEIRSSIP